MLANILTLPKCKNQSVAHCYLRGGFSVIPVKLNSKEPAVKWKDYTERQMDSELVPEFFKNGSNIAVVTGRISNLTVLDIDDKELFSGFYDFEKLMDEAKTVVKSPNGYHFWFKYDEELKTKQHRNFGFDLKNDGSLITVPPSKVGDRVYGFVKSDGVGDIPRELKEKLLQLQKPTVSKDELMLQEVLSRVRVDKQLPDGVYRCYCPAHDDQNSSLDVGLKDGKLFIRCWAGCTQEEVLQAIGLEKGAERDSTSQKLLKIAEGYEYWRNKNKEEFVTVTVGGEIRNLRVNSTEFKKLLQFKFCQRYGKAAHTQALYEVITALAGKALVEGKEYQTFVRVGKIDDLIELDLCNGKVVQITKEKIEIVTTPFLKFERTTSSLPLPDPDLNVEKEEWELLAQIINTSRNDLILMLAWLLGCFNIDGEFPILNITGEREGIGKTTATAFLKSIVDPSVVNIKPLPKTEDDFVVVCLHNHIVAFDNLSHITDTMSDALCRISTGSALAKRKLFTDTEAVQYFVKKPVILNGIDLFAERRDLRRRCVHVELERIDKPRPINLLSRQFQSIHPKILGWLIKSVQLALKEEISETLDLTDLASFVSFICRTEKMFPVSGRQFIDLFKTNRLNVSIATISENPITTFLNELLADKEEWQGSMTELYSLFFKKYADTPFKSQIPKDAKSLSRKIRRLISDLENMGVEVTFSRDEKVRSIHIKKDKKFNVSNVISSFSLKNQALTDDDIHDDNDDNENIVRISSSHNPLKNKENDDNDDNDDNFPTFLKKDIEKEMNKWSEIDWSEIDLDDIEVLEEEEKK